MFKKMLKYKKLELGMSYYECENCGNFHITFHTCKSSFCPTCGKKRRNQIAANVSRKIKRRNQIAANVSRKIINVPHRQLVFTLPKELRGYFRLYKDLLSILFEAANESLVNILKNHAPKKFREEKRKIGAICFLYTFGRDLKWHPHIHVLFAEKDIFEEFRGLFIRNSEYFVGNWRVRV